MEDKKTWTEKGIEKISLEIIPSTYSHQLNSSIEKWHLIDD